MTAKIHLTAENILKQTLGPASAFREGQWEAIEAVVQQRQRLVVVQRTGWGKSLVYFIATRLNRIQNRGITVLVSPLLSLMRNQIAQAEKFGLCAKRIDSTNRDEHNSITQALISDQVDLLLISPERLSNQAFRASIWPTIRPQIGLLVIDEVHCISDWGHDFRPDYRRVMHILAELPSSTSVLGTTATANTRVIDDIQTILGGDVQVSRGSLMRESLRLYTYPEPMSAANRLVLLSHLLRSIAGTGIIYCTTIRDCEIVAKWLIQEGFPVAAYHSQAENREQLETDLLQNRLKALVASVALGMGFDKPDLSFVIHYQLPGSIISYYQQIGRAGRGIDNAHVILMHGPEDREIQEYFLDSAFPPVDIMQAAAQQFERGRSFSRSELLIEFNLNNSVADKIIQQFEIEGYIVSTDAGYVKTGQSVPDFSRWQEITARRYRELEQIEAFIASGDCLMKFLAYALEDPTHPDRCNRCKNCRSSKSIFAPDEDAYRRAQHFLWNGEPLWIKPRLQWARRRMITPRAKLKHTNETGMALSFYNDEGWGKSVKAGKYIQKRFSQELVAASQELIQRHWAGQIMWVTNIPSTRHPHLVSDFARRLADALHLPYVEAVLCTSP